jgi:N-acetylglutamate synthase-like GNAT family acetyltransferase
MRIRTATDADLQSVYRLLQKASLPTDGLEEQFGPGYAVALEGDQIVGAAGIERYGRSGLLRSVVTAAEARGRGIAEALTRNRLDWAATEGLDMVYLLTTTAAGYFPRLGFEPVDRTEVPAEVQASREFSSICPASAVAMRRPVGI